jgi:SAM-dependent methyltransferase
MKNKTRKRETYHPKLASRGTFVGGRRDFQRRLHIVESEVDFTGKRVLDLGCSGGFFTFSIAQKAASVTGVDANPHLIDQNRHAAKRFDYPNTEFLCEPITTDLVSGLPHYDVVLFLSVLHHIIAGSITYAEWNQYHLDEVFGMLAAIQDTADVYVFETGQPDEFERWSPTLKSVMGTPREWIAKHVFGTSYDEVIIRSGPAYQRFPYRWLPQLYSFDFGTSSAAKPLGWIKRNLIKLGGVNPRDFRDIYIGKKYADCRQ